MISRIGKAALLLAVLFVGVLPVLYLLLANDELDTGLVSRLSWQNETFRLSWKTARLAMVTACVSSGIAWAVCAMLRASARPRFWLALYVLCFTVSPYIAAQGWIQILGVQGTFWKLLALTPRAGMLFGPSGLVFMMSLQMTPLALFIFASTYRPLDRESQDLQALTKLPAWKKLYVFHLRPGKAPLLFALVLVFWLAFWNYETPSILRQNTYALNLYAAFGSFYDDNQALGYLFHALIYAVPTLVLIVWMSPALAANIRSLPHARENTNSRLQKLARLFGLSLIPLCGLVLPVAGLIGDLAGMESLTTAIQTILQYSGDIKNTLVVASSASLIATMTCFALVYLGSIVNARAALALPALLLLIIPPLCTGIGAVHWFAENSAGAAGLERIVLVNALILLPILLLPASLAFPRNATARSDTRRLYHIGDLKQFALLARPVLLPRFLLLFGLGFLMAMKEVPASLLNYPPDGSTLALTIETMLHFDQPQLISALCLIQLLISLVIFSTITVTSHLCQR